MESADEVFSQTYTLQQQRRFLVEEEKRRLSATRATDGAKEAGAIQSAGANEAGAEQSAGANEAEVEQLARANEARAEQSADSTLSGIQVIVETHEYQFCT